MRFIFKTRYEQDIALAKHDGHRFWYSLLVVALFAAPWLLSEYGLAQLTFVLRDQIPNAMVLVNPLGLWLDDVGGADPFAQHPGMPSEVLFSEAGMRKQFGERETALRIQQQQPQKTLFTRR